MSGTKRRRPEGKAVRRGTVAVPAKSNREGRTRIDGQNPKPHEVGMPVSLPESQDHGTHRGPDTGDKCRRVRAFSFSIDKEATHGGQAHRERRRVLSIRVPSAMARELVARAKHEDRSLNSLVRIFIRKALETNDGVTMTTA